MVPEPNSGCWLWDAGVGKSGYGVFKKDGRSISAHRFSYEEFVGPIPDEMHVLHKCDVRTCVNPDHLFVGTHDDNMKDSSRKGRKPRGEDNRAAKLSADDVREIRKWMKAGVRQELIAKCFGISQSAVGNISTAKSWGWLK